MSIVLTKPTETQTVTARDQRGNVFTGDVGSVSVTNDHPEFVGASLSAFANGVASLTLTQGAEGVANIAVTNGVVSSPAEVVDSYVPVLAAFQIGDAA